MMITRSRVFVLFVFRVFLLNNVTGIKVFDDSLKVVHGDEVVPHSLPYVVALKTVIDEKEVQCGGSLIQANKVLTAAYCVYGAETVEVILGAHNLTIVEDTQVHLESSNFTVHEEYDTENHLNDIAVVYLSEDVTLTDAIQTIQTPSLVEILDTYADETGLVAGWGKFDDNDPNYSDVLRKIEATILPHLACSIPYLFQIQTYQMCTSGVQNRQNICLGDTGSPLVVNGVQVGIASYGSDLGCSVGWPGVHTRLTSYYFWLESN